MRILFSLILVLALAACGDHDHGEGSHTHDKNGTTSHGHGDHHGESHHIGHKELENGYFVEVGRVGDLEAGKEGVFEVGVKKDGADIADATVICWLEDAEGNAVTRTPKGLYMSEEKLYDVHMTLPAEMKTGMILKVRIQHQGQDQTAAIPLK